jgi:hypothetical protein
MRPMAFCSRKVLSEKEDLWVIAADRRARREEGGDSSCRRRSRILVQSFQLEKASQTSDRQTDRQTDGPDHSVRVRSTGTVAYW